mgnify:CR=1 FL=1
MRRLPATFFPGANPNHIYLIAYGDWLTKQNITSNTKRIYLSRVKQFILFLDYAELNYPPLDNVHNLRKAVSTYLEFLKNSKRENITINANIDALKNFFQFLGIKADIELERKRCYRNRTKVLDSVEQIRFLECVEKQKSSRDKALALILFHTGLRIGDCARLELDNMGPAAISINLANNSRIF